MMHRNRKISTVATILVISVIVMWWFPRELDIQPSMKDICESPQAQCKDIPAVVEPLENWKLQTAGRAPANEELKRISNYINKKQYQCTSEEYLGVTNDVHNRMPNLCTEVQFWPLQKNEKHKCLVYSFGLSERGYLLEEDLSTMGCEVHTFGRSEMFETMGTEEFTNINGVKIHNIEISDEDDLYYKSRKLRTILSEFGHNNKYLDYLMIDTNGQNNATTESTLMTELIETNLHTCVRQFSVFTHLRGPLTEPINLEWCRKLYQLIRKLNYLGWRIYSITDEDTVSTANVSNEEILYKEITVTWRIVFVNFNVLQPCIIDI